MTCVLWFLDTHYFRYVAKDLFLLLFIALDDGMLMPCLRKQREEYAAAMEGDVRTDDVHGVGDKDSELEGVKDEADYGDDKKAPPSVSELEMALVK